MPEPTKRAGSAASAAERSDFARDRARVLHAYAFRRLADKTQVNGRGGDDFPRTRLTHSLEVAQIGREIGAALGCDPDIVDTAGLAHDIGHPPFGHNGEAALDAVAADCGGFEGNAQTLRVLTRLEPRAQWRSGAPAGLNLTRAVLDATCKYPWLRGTPGRPTAKYGGYAEDRAAFDWVRATAPPAGRRCLEAQVMDWADDVAYSVHDLEDGVHAGLIRLAELDADERAALCQVAAELYSPLPASALAVPLDRLLALAPLRDLAGAGESYAAAASAKRATSELTGRLAGAAVAATRAAYPGDDRVRYGADLVVPPGAAAECALLKAIAMRYVMRRAGALQRQADQRALLRELVEAVHAGAPGTLEPALAEAWWQADSDAARLRAVIDQIAQLTDSAARSWHRRLVAGDA